MPIGSPPAYAHDLALKTEALAGVCGREGGRDPVDYSLRYVDGQSKLWLNIHAVQHPQNYGLFIAVRFLPDLCQKNQLAVFALPCSQ